MATLITTNVWNEITAAAKNTQKPSQVAVAYFGSKGPSLLPLLKGSALVADVSIPTVTQGSTSPAALNQLCKAGIDVYSVQYLHAKVFAFETVAFVGSTNASERSDGTLVEAALRTRTASEIRAVRNFVASLCVTKLSASDLKDLESYYKPPKFATPQPIQQQNYSTLLMELTLEQGVDRASQVQPPKSVWESFFGLKHPTATLPTITLVNERTLVPEIRPVVKHHHTYTIEISDADLPRPAILQVRRLGPNKYSYVVHRPADAKFSDIRRIVRTLHNPFWVSGRRWVLV
ncbi:hypothetical protein BRDID11004_60360 [Bradyrhizobium diazoefficiens]|uniref:Phospholipase D-like domain-containing protein n=1 Tax=Bradyrhizobium diazoefficiens TaxID=1355477 RepID=A0A809ZR72_9BRAD|nr:hypothetical protein [Bradyrhizobium diazoefficiens]BCA10816.1 hypothetical protein BDHF08_26630 [Bradyrhizobium diazoefficiens]BCE55152.1 hypothetical protein XF5B_26640 [Bradyrhizobium diazoefficiens]BCE63885.1 hypothetical protein XF6B_26840 [Bradyrhizobium diazoefficiens]